ncbi:MAG: hypothetical protein COV59_02645 [Candidatus Magasanikbacteria bacterium CG11_big_fil_rev_8_21_14_0_20_39_34]|uniref:Uncharacterized protein n=1 Tax=Candidatus Magasanikbacteria bacterium CG11_big_fil_rev_8_21_14_0_20_39_34 TaxID=1974653 RepID=A0A2H0N594_9BACT|nr:MAG: hypothetical protein COV59_02645 [Candidatus Magasanikbacteria bacterium CG11_big_fil_rev_8_21_14_0_20_39_34]
MRKAALHEVAKLASGLVLGDFIFGLWFYFGGHLPMTFWGISFTEQNVIGWLLFDVVLFAILVHYGWRLSMRPTVSHERKFHMVAGVVFALVALLHLSRIIFGWNFVIGSWNAPYWLNGLGTILTAFLAFTSFHFGKKN